MEGSEKPREHDKHIMDCCSAGPEQEVFKWTDRTGARWLSQLCDEAGTHLRTETLSRLTSNTPVLHATNGTDTARVLDDILGEATQLTREQAQKKNSGRGTN